MNTTIKWVPCIQDLLQFFKKCIWKSRIILFMELLCSWLNKQDIPKQLLTQEEYTLWVEGRSIRKACNISVIYSFILSLILKLSFLQSCCLFDLPTSSSPSFSRTQISEFTYIKYPLTVIPLQHSRQKTSINRYTIFLPWGPNWTWCSFPT